MEELKEVVAHHCGVTVHTLRRIGGGCINEGFRVDTSNGSFFVKCNSSEPESMFAAEMRGLDEMAQTKTIRVPQPIQCGTLSNGTAYLIMEYIEFGSPRSGSWALFGEAMARLHLVGSHSKFGFHVNNTIGSTPQINDWCDDWIEFFRNHRLRFQVQKIKEAYNDETIETLGLRLEEKLPYLFSNCTIKPALLHGDLWSGNCGFTKDGEPVIFDPATYYGHNEMEFSISTMFGGFPPAFFEAYHKVIPRQEGWKARQRLYQLYHYLNHYLLFGSGYRSSCISIMQELTKNS